MRTVVAGCAAVALIAAIAAPSALAQAANIGAGVGASNVFAAPSYGHQAGTLATMTWGGGGSHNVTATGDGPDGEALFRSDTISGGTIPVNGTQYVGPGSYSFICTIHPATMQATLNVAGTPLARPELSLKVKSGNLAQALRSGEVKVEAKVSGGSGEEAEVTAQLGKREIAKPKSTSRTRALKLKLTKKGRKLLAKRGKAKIKARGSIEFGSPATAKRVLK